jgi:hypothetical protein
MRFDLWARQFVVVRDKDVVLPFLHILGFLRIWKSLYTSTKTGKFHQSSVRRKSHDYREGAEGDQVERGTA